MLGARSDEGSSKLATLVASAASQHTASSVSTLESGQAESSNSAATQLGPSKQRTRMRRLILGVVALGLASHVLIHSYASQLADTGQLLRFVKPVASNNAARVGVALTQPKVAGSSAAARAQIAVRSRSCGAKLSVLVIHEHHLKPIGSDLRLLGIIRQLRALGHTVSLLFRGKTPADQRSPPTAELASLLGATSGETEYVLTSTDRPPQPPAIFEYSDLESFSVIARQGWFDAVLCPLWFWRDPMASAAELLLPTLALHAPPGQRPFIAALSDDAHSAKALMMAEWESGKERKELWEGKAKTLPPRQRAVYSLADAVVHISEADANLEKAMFNSSCAHWRVLRMSPRGVHSTADDKAPMTSEAAEAAKPAAEARQLQQQQQQHAPGDALTASTSLRFGFIGNGITPTNHLAVQWFLKSVWPSVRRALPGARLRLVGYAPDDRPKRGQNLECAPSSSPVRCGWAWSTSYAGHEASGGVDELGFISDEAMLAELLTWRAMVVPILRSTGVNTKILPALQWGVPIVLTSVAASPLRIPTTDDSVALIADSAEAFSAQLQRLHAQPELAARLASAALGHWAALLEEDKTASDLANLLSLACDVVRKPEAARPIPQPIAAAAPSELRADLSSARRVPPASKCFTGGPSRRVAHLVAVPLPGAQGAGGGSIQDGGGGGSNDDGVDGGGSNSADADGDDDNAGGDENDDGGSYGDFPPAIVVEMHSAAASEAAVFLAHAAWQAVCSHCSLRCVHSRGGQEPPRDWDILIEHEMTASPNQLATHLIAASKAMDPRPLHVVHSPAAQFPAALGMYWTRGGVLASISHSERASARLALLLEAGGFDTTRVHTLGLEPIANGTRGAGLLGATWRALLGSIGIKPTEVGPLVSKIERLRLQLLGAAPSWQGCWKDSKQERQSATGPRTFGHTTLACATACYGSPYFALQNGGQCFCRSAAPTNASRRVSSTNCGTVCPTEEGKLPARLCGGGWRNALFENPLGFVPHPGKISTVTSRASTRASTAGSQNAHSHDHHGHSGSSGGNGNHKSQGSHRAASSSAQASSSKGSSSTRHAQSSTKKSHGSNASSKKMSTGSRHHGSSHGASSKSKKKGSSKSHHHTDSAGSKKSGKRAAKSRSKSSSSKSKTSKK